MKGQSHVDRYVLNGTTYTVDPRAKLGAGSEGMVIAHPRDPDFCVKLFHPPEPGDRSAANLATFRDRKLRFICGSGLVLPSHFMLPMTPVFDTGNQKVAGFQMRRVPPDYQKLMKLLDGEFRTNHQVGLGTIAELFADIFDDLALLHGSGIVVGDVNLGCLLFQPGGDRAWVDTDSWSYKGFPCLPVTELFAHPDLYVNLQAGGKRVNPQPHHDRFSFLIALTMMAIPGAHPFRMGMHPTLKGLQNRTTAGVTIFDPDVKVPSLLSTFEMLSDEVLHAIVERLKRRDDSPINPQLLRNFAQELVGCNTCDLEYHSSRRHCPRCQTVTMVQAAKLVSYLIEELLSVRGTLLFAQLVGQNLYLVCRMRRSVRIIRVDAHGKAVTLGLALPNIPGARYRFFRDCLVVCPNPSQPAPATLELYRIEGDNLRQLTSTSTGVLEGENAVFDTSQHFLYRMASNALVRSELFGQTGVTVDTHIGEVHQRQSWFTVDHVTGADREVIFGYDRALRSWQWFVIHGNAADTRYQYHTIGDLGLRLGETVEDFAVHFSSGSVLLVMATSLAGRDAVRYAVIGLDGTVHFNRIVDSSSAAYSHWANLRGKLHQGKSVLHVTPDGIVKQDFSTEQCTTLTDTTGHILPDDRLVRLWGKVGIVRRTGVLAMSGKK